MRNIYSLMLLNISNLVENKWHLYKFLYLTHCCGSQQSLSKFHCSTTLKSQFKFAFSNPITIWLSATFASYIISTKNWLFQSYFAQCNKWETERLHLFLLILSIEDHSMRCQVQSAMFLPNKLRLFLSMKFHINIVAEEYDARD